MSIISWSTLSLGNNSSHRQLVLRWNLASPSFTGSSGVLTINQQFNTRRHRKKKAARVLKLIVYSNQEKHLVAGISKIFKSFLQLHRYITKHLIENKINKQIKLLGFRNEKREKGEKLYHRDEWDDLSICEQIVRRSHIRWPTSPNEFSQCLHRWPPFLRCFKVQISSSY